MHEPVRANKLAMSLEILRYKSLGSTNTKAYQLAERGAREWTVVVSEVQTRGRGRAGKTWVSARGGLWFSVILRPSVGAGNAGLLQILAGVSARRAIEKVSGVKVRLKWPNDLVLAEGKLGGILVETKMVADAVSFAVLGIGINVNQPERSPPEGAVSILSETSRRTSLQKLLAAVLQELRSDYDRLRSASELAAEWWRHCIHRDKTVRVEGSNWVVIGLSTGLSNDGLLLVETRPGKVVTVTEGTLRVLD